MRTDEMKDTAYASYIIWRSTVISVNCRYICKLSILDKSQIQKSEQTDYPGNRHSSISAGQTRYCRKTT